MDRIEETKNYDLFELNILNREPKTNTKRFKKLLESMKKYGWIPAMPMHVTRNGDGVLRIKQGHNRFQAAKILGIGVKYVICDDDAPLTIYEGSYSPWNTKDYSDSYGNAGYTSYTKLNDYCRRFGIPRNVAIPLLQKDGVWGQYIDTFKDGKFKIGNPTHAEMIGGLVLFCADLGIKFARNSRFVWALHKVLQVDGVELEELKKKIKNHLYVMANQADVKGYIMMLETVYNRSRGKKLAIAINAMS